MAKIGQKCLFFIDMSMLFLKKQTAETRINTGFAGILPVCLCYFLIIMRKKYKNIYNRAQKSRQTGRDRFFAYYSWCVIEEVITMKILNKIAWLIGLYCLASVLGKCLCGLKVWIDQIRKHITGEF